MAGAVALLVQMLGWAFLMTPVSLAGDIEALCSVNGEQAPGAGVDAGAPGDDGRQGGAHGGGCPLCALAHGLGVPPPGFQPLPPRVMAAHAATGLPGHHIAAGWFLSSLKARAPPLSI